MSLLEKINTCDPSEIDNIITEEIKKANSGATKVEHLGFDQGNGVNHFFKGFIPLDARIRYCGGAVEDYGMETTDYMYEFTHFLKDNNINNSYLFITLLPTFINLYFGNRHSDIDRRMDIFNDKADKAETDDEYFAILSQNKIGDLKGKGEAMCTEVAAVTEELLSLYGFETYYVTGAIKANGKPDGHCFNVVKRKNDYALLDCSMTVPYCNKDKKKIANAPFVGSMSNEDFIGFKNGEIKSFQEYEQVGNQKSFTDKTRSYIDEILEQDKLKDDDTITK